MKKFNKIDLRLNKKPKISVILSFFNNNETLELSIKSIINQSYKNFELILISDGSNDLSNKIVQKFLIKKNNILYLRSRVNMGLTKMLNVGIKYSRGDFIARQDADDFSFSSRFKKQIDYFEKNNDVDILGSNAVYIIKNKKQIIKMPEKDINIKQGLPYKNTIIHPTVMMRKKIFNKNIFYNENYLRCQDYELWLRVKNKVKFYNIQKNLVKRIVNPKNFKIKDLILSSKARFTHCSLFLSSILFGVDLSKFILKRIFFTFKL